MKIKLTVSKEKNLLRLNKLTDDPAFVASILKNMGYENCPDSIEIRLDIIKPKNENDKKN